MSTYLERLVNRLIQPEMEVQPRLPGLFEPGPLGAQAANLEAATDVSASGSERAQGEAGEAVFSNNAVTGEDPSQKPPTSPSQPAIAEQAQPQPSQPLQPATPESRDLTALQPPQWSPREAQVVPIEKATSPTFPAAIPSESFVREAPKEAARSETLPGSEISTEEHKTKPGSLFPYPADLKPAQLPGENPAEPIHAASRPILTRLAAPEANSAEPTAAPAQPTQAGAAPQIHVTIGRIEVRAANPPPVAPRKTPARQGPVVSLEDYLKRRQGGSK